MKRWAGGGKKEDLEGFACAYGSGFDLAFHIQKKKKFLHD